MLYICCAAYVRKHQQHSPKKRTPSYQVVAVLLHMNLPSRAPLFGGCQSYCQRTSSANAQSCAAPQWIIEPPTVDDHVQVHVHQGRPQTLGGAHQTIGQRGQGNRSAVPVAAHREDGPDAVVAGELRVSVCVCVSALASIMLWRTNAFRRRSADVSASPRT